MSITRKMLKAMGIEDEDKITQIIDEHQSVVQEISKERDEYKIKADKLTSVERDLVKANAKLEDAEEISQKYKDLQKEYADFKADINAKNLKVNKASKYKELLTKAGIPEKRQDAIVRVTDLDEIKLDKDGKIENVKELSEAINTEWADFIVTEKKQGANVSNPPENNGGTAFDKMSLAEKMVYANEHPDSVEVKTFLGEK